jgi:aspartate/methionine/tyrosine aminotransferase
MARSLGFEVDAETRILVGNGGTHALFCAARAVLDPDDEVILAGPHWPLAPGVFVSAGARPVTVAFSQRLYEDPALDPAELFAVGLGPRTRAIYFISPNNPDGKVLSRAQLERVAAFAIAKDLWVFADEVYADSVFGAAPPSIATLPGMGERTIVLRSLSKSHALAGLRVGFFAGPAAVVSVARRVSTHSAFNVSVAMQRAALAALEDRTFPTLVRESYRAARDRTIAALEALGPRVRFHAPEGATYVFLDFAPAFAEAPRARAETEDRPPLYALLDRAVERGVLLAPGDAFGDRYATSARLCFSAVTPERVVTGVERLADAVDAYVAGRS